MYRGFMLSCDDDFLYENDFYDFYDKGKRIFDEYKTQVLDSIEYYYTEDILDGTAIQDDWFPQIKCDIFISHSHKDENLAIALAGWLWETFRLKAFVDSSIWGYADDLINKLLEETDDNYSHNERNNSDLIYITSHVHNMLTVALMKMIDKTECLFFLKTPNSAFFDCTLSPWIYTEIGISMMIQKRRPQRPMQISDSRIAHELDLSHLSEIDYRDLNEWEESNTQGYDALDTLYRLKKYRKKRTINV